jgi:hypothetical protein
MFDASLAPPFPHKAVSAGSSPPLARPERGHTTARAWGTGHEILKKVVAPESRPAPVWQPLEESESA